MTEEHICRFSSPHETKKGMKALTSKAMEWFTAKKKIAAFYSATFAMAKWGNYPGSYVQTC